MSTVAELINSLVTSRNTIRSKLVSLGLSGNTDKLAKLAEDINSMTDNGKVTPSALAAGGEYTIPEGYHNGEGKVTAQPLASQTGVDAGKTAADAASMRSGYQAWVNGAKISGTMPNASIYPMSALSVPDTTVSCDVEPDRVHDSSLKIEMADSADTFGGYVEAGRVQSERNTVVYIDSMVGLATPTDEEQVIHAPERNGKTTLFNVVVIDPVPVDSSNSFTTNGTKTPASGKFFSSVNIDVPTGTARSSADVTASGATVTVPAGLYSAQVTKSVSTVSPTAVTLTGLGSVAGDSSYTIPAGYHDGTGTVSLTNDILTQLQAI